ncbi:SCP2 sterol-binding domain-containing protein [Deinococcus irradiatisoli]|uniref:SCP2 sterol-binding domain-containing protein n=1 Tax=Deinococcus irradiatisoli TaxID=2202254 RepID=UPI0015E858A7|nr:SCP2 sterol-binding domain-containing protein [Deinococcus irradiatisoli]
MTPPLRFSAAQLQDVLGRVYAEVGDEPQAAVLGTRRLTLAFAFSEPELHLTVDGRSGQAVVRVGADAPAPDLTFYLAGENIDRFWRGDLNPLTALAAGQLRIEGPLLTALALAPALPALQARYRDLTAVWRAPPR